MIAMADDANRCPVTGAMAERPSAETPAHVPPELVREYDQVMAASTLDDPYAPAWEVFKTYPPVFFARSRGGALGGGPGAWVCSHYEDIREVLQNTEHYSSEGIFPFQYLVGESFRAIPISVDPPEHSRYRLFLNPWFSPKAVNVLEAQIHEIVNRLIDGFAEAGACDLAYDFARVYPVKVFMRLMGFPDEKFEDFLSWGYAMLHHSHDIEKVRWGARSALDYLRSFIEEVRRAPGEGLASRIVHGEVDGAPITEDEVIGILFFLWIGGLDTVAATTTLMFRQLALDPALQQRLRENPDQHTEAVEEFLRMNPTVNTARVAKVDHELHGVQIKKGDRMSCLVAAGNYDPVEFDDSRAFHTDRSSNRHLTFIAGPHRCLGSHLARRELRIALSEFLRRVPPFRMKAGADRTVVPGLIAMPHLPLVWDAKG
jgi:cytochrome P450